MYASLFQLSGDKGKRAVRKKRDRDRRLEKRCPFCPLVTKQHLDRHIMRRHKDKVGSSIKKAKEVSSEVTARASLATKGKKSLGSIGMAELSAMYGDTWTFPNVKENTLALLRYFNIEVQENIEAPMDQDPESAADEDPESSDQDPGGQPVDVNQRVSVKRRKKDLGLYEQVPSTHPVIKRYKETRERLGKNARSCENSCKRLGQMFAYAQKKRPDKSPWMLLVDFHVFWEFLEESRDKCGTLPATLLTYVKDMVCVCLYARERWTRDPDLPRTEDYLLDLQEAHVFWQDKLAVLNKETDAARNARLATGTAKVSFVNSKCVLLVVILTPVLNFRSQTSTGCTSI